MRTKRFIVKIALRRLIASSTPEEEKAIKRVLQNDDMLGLLAVQLHKTAAPKLKGLGDGWILGMFQWIIDHPKEVMKFIAILITIFGDTK